MPFWNIFLLLWKRRPCSSNPLLLTLTAYSFISMRLIYYFDTWTIIWNGIVPVFLKICTNLHRCDQKIVFVIVWPLKLFRNNNKNNFVITSVQICANLQKSWNNTMSNDGSIIKNMDLSHIHKGWVAKVCARTHTCNVRSHTCLCVRNDL